VTLLAVEKKEPFLKKHSTEGYSYQSDVKFLFERWRFRLM